MVTLAEENYLKAILKLSKNGSIAVSTSAISNELNTKASSVTDMIKKLTEKKLVIYQPYFGVKLNKEGYLIDLMESYQIDLVVLAGFLLMIPFDFIKHFKGKIINIHPSLLPKYGGKGMYGDHVHRAVLKNNESTSGITFHYVNENYDEGQIISQFEVSLSQEETLASLKHKIDVLEKKHYPLVISSILNE